MFDTLILNGMLYDGSGAPGRKADLAIKEGYIAAIGDLSHASAGDKIDVMGMAVAPGFIDLHTHSDFTLVVDGQAQSQVHQGVTTEVIGQCGSSCAPMRDRNARPPISAGHAPDAVGDKRWQSFGEYLDVLEQSALGVNVAAFVGHGTVHSAVLGDALTAGDDADVAKMKRLVEESLDQGAAGLSTGLEYWPGLMSGPEHLIPLCEVTGQRGKLYATHVRNRDRFYDLGFTEAIAMARESGVRLQISHIQTKFGAPPHAMEHTLELIDLARRQGQDIAFDVIPHDWNNTTVMSILPKWVREGGVKVTLERLKDPIVREKVKANQAPMLLIVKARQWDDIVLLNAANHRDLVGMSFAEIGRMRDVDPYDALMDLLIEEGEAAARMMWATRSFRNEDIEMAMQDSSCAVISDTAALSPEGRLSEQLFSLSGYGWAPRFLQYYVRDRKILDLAQAIRRITSLPASRIGIKDRGTLAKGQCADIVVFDASEIASTFSVKQPRQHPVGISHVVVNGSFAIRHGRRTCSNSGKVLRNTGVQ